jgi:putative ABC transport system substrate-binding protein
MVAKVRLGICTWLAIWAMAGSPGAAADAPPKIGALVRPLVNAPYEAGLRAGLRDLGYTEGRNIVIDWRRSNGGDEDRLLAIELARSSVNVVVVFSTPGAQAAMQANPKMPVVFLAGDPVATGLAASIAKPGRNGTGVTGVLTELVAKRVELLHQLAPGARRIVCLVNPNNPVSVLQFDAAKAAARGLGVPLTKLDARNSTELDVALLELKRTTGSALVVTGDAVLLVNKDRIVRAVRDAKVPASFPYRDYHDDGALMSYGMNPYEVGRKMAGYVDKILKGAKPGDLPIERISEYELIINVRVARELGLEVPQNLLMRADEVLK